jgi:hypothetical protein
MPPGNWGHIAEVRVVGQIHGSQTVNVWHLATDEIVNDPGSLDTLLLQLAEAMLACVIDTLLPAVSQDWSATQVEAKRIFPTPSDPLIATAPANSVGSLGPASVSFAASLVNVRTGQGGRSGRGKKFLPPPGEPETVNSEMDQPTLALITQFLLCVAGKFMGANPTTPWHLGVFSRKLAGGVIANANTGFQVVSSLNPVAKLAIMSSRKKGVGS